MTSKSSHCAPAGFLSRDQIFNSTTQRVLGRARAPCSRWLSNTHNVAQCTHVSCTSLAVSPTLRLWWEKWVPVTQSSNTPVPLRSKTCTGPRRQMNRGNNKDEVHPYRVENRMQLSHLPSLPHPVSPSVPVPDLYSVCSRVIRLYT